MKESSNLLATVLELKTQRTGVYNSSISGQYLSNCTGPIISKAFVRLFSYFQSNAFCGNIYDPIMFSFYIYL